MLDGTWHKGAKDAASKQKRKGRGMKMMPEQDHVISRLGNEPMFPSDARLHTGITIRQYFVAQAMVAAFSSVPRELEVATKERIFDMTKCLAVSIIELADACLAREAETRETKP